MTKNNSLWLTAAISAALCVGVLIYEHSAIGAVRDEIGQLKKRITAHSKLDSGATPVAPNGERQPDRPGQISVVELIAMLPDDDRDPTGSFKAFGSVLERIRDYSTPELLELIAAVGELVESDPSMGQKLGFPRMMLMIIAAGDAPEEILQMAEDENDELRSSAFASLVEKDPRRARQYLEEVEWSARETQKAQAVLFAGLLKEDVPQALDLFRDGSWNLSQESAVSIGGACADPAVREKLWLAAREEGDSAVLLQLSKGLVFGELMGGGMNGLRQAFASADFFDADLKATLVQQFAGEAMSSEPVETVAWIRESIPAEEAPAAVARAVGSWARRDFNAAGTWLGEQPPSPERDRSIASFASTVTEIDPAAAATWATEISDLTLRDETLEKTLEKWKATDPAAAEVWINAQAASD